MHDSVLAWTRKVLTVEHVRGQRVIEVGSYNVNGSVRPIVGALGPDSYLGIDIGAGPGVDQVCDLAQARSRFGQFELVISTEMLEHVVDWKISVLALADLVIPGGYLLVTTRSPGFPYHPYPIDTWRYTVDAMYAIARLVGLTVEELEDDPEAPGVFLLARRPGIADFDFIPGVTAMVP
jgi:2-polyprenyl-3-methyl-5-hydroxy-6-metoxy-1,4-benzoquinol methylase